MPTSCDRPARDVPSELPYRLPQRRLAGGLPLRYQLPVANCDSRPAGPTPWWSGTARTREARSRDGRDRPVRSSTQLRIICFLAALAAFTAMQATANAASRHNETVLRVAERQCKNGIGNADFCNCAIQHLENDVNPKYAVLFTYSRGSKKIQYVDLSPDIPKRKLNKIEGSIADCRQKYAPQSFGLQ
jgi:hypothetical protein